MFASTRTTRSFQLYVVISVVLGFALAAPSLCAAQADTQWVPGEDWMRYADVAEAGFDATPLPRRLQYLGQPRRGADDPGQERRGNPRIRAVSGTQPGQRERAGDDRTDSREKAAVGQCDIA